MDGWLKGKKRQKRYKDAQGRKKEKMDKENGKKKKKDEYQSLSGGHPNQLTGHSTWGAQLGFIPRRTNRVTLWGPRKPVSTPHSKAIPRSTPPICCLSPLPSTLSQRAKGSAAEELALLSAPFLLVLFILGQQLTEPPSQIN